MVHRSSGAVANHERLCDSVTTACLRSSAPYILRLLFQASGSHGSTYKNVESSSRHSIRSLPHTLNTMGILFSAKFDPSRDLLDLTSRVVIVTGGNVGRYSTIKHLARYGARVSHVIERRLELTVRLFSCRYIWHHDRRKRFQ
jgi:hypothetical protein